MEIWLKGSQCFLMDTPQIMLIIILVTTPEDVESAIEYGVDGVVISNHGGRQLDGMPATVDALAEIAPLAAGKIQLAVDGGIRRGSDIFKALALGAKYCFIGRIPIWGLAVGPLSLHMDSTLTTFSIRASRASNLQSRFCVTSWSPQWLWLGKLGHS